MRNGSGGHNRTHNTVEDFKRLDSFHYNDFLLGDKYLWLHDTVVYPNSSQPDIIYYVQDRKFEILTGTQYSPLFLSRVPGINGNGERVFFNCPHCYARVRYLYKNNGNYMCRHCLNANYKIQQINGRRKLVCKMEHVLEKLGYSHWRHLHPRTNIENLLIVPRPRYMRIDEYNRLSRQFRDMQEEYHDLDLYQTLKYMPQGWLNEIMEK